MPSQYDPAGQQDLREYITNNWLQLALVDDSNIVETVIDIPSDSRTSWSDPDTNPIEVTADISSGDGDISAPVEFTGAALFVAGAPVTVGDPISVFTPAHFAGFENVGTVFLGSGESVTLIHEIQQPEIIN
jgi:hypothetical protein